VPTTPRAAASSSVDAGSVTYHRHPPALTMAVAARQGNEEIQEQDRYITIANIVSIMKNQPLENVHVCEETQEQDVTSPPAP